jgi:CRISPR/Cas system-associated exonuclease Cas4 (RecB family)
LKFLTCNKSVSLRSEYPNIRVKTPQKALLGQIAHRVLEVASAEYRNIDPDNFSDIFEEIWKEAENEYVGKYVKEWAPNPVAQVQSWKFYFKTKVAAKGLLKARILITWARQDNSRQENNVVRILTEEYIEDQVLGIEGYVDKIVIYEDCIHIIDYKFGQSDLDSQQYKIQLGIYSILVSRKFGLPVKNASVIAGVGREHRFEFDARYLEDLLFGISEAQTILKENRAKASPSLSNCRFCSFKPVCIEFNQAELTSDNGIPLAVKGKIVSSRTINEDFDVLTIASHGPGKQEYQVSKVPAGHGFRVGELVHLSGPMQFFSNYIVEAKPNTIFWRLS